MGDYGIKITIPGEDVSSSTRDHYAFWSKYQSLPLLYKVQQSISVNSGGCSGTSTYTHNLGFFPLVLGFVDSIPAGRQAIPFTASQDSDKFNCGGDNLSEDFSMKIKVNTVEIIYNITCIIPMVGSRCIDVSKTYTVDLYFYMFQLGS